MWFMIKGTNIIKQFAVIYLNIFKSLVAKTVTFGEHDRCDDRTRPETRFVLRAISQKFSYSNFDSDMALLRLNEKVPITDFIRPICLPTNKGN